MRTPEERERIERMTGTTYPNRIRTLAQDASVLIEDYQSQMELEPPDSARLRAYRMTAQALEALNDAVSSFEGNSGPIPARAILCKDCRFWTQKGMETGNVGHCLMGGSLYGKPDEASTSAYADDSEEHAASLITMNHHGCVQGKALATKENEDD